MCEIFVAVPLTNECCARRKIAAEQLASASGENPCAHAMENPTLKSGWRRSRDLNPGYDSLVLLP